LLFLGAFSVSFVLLRRREAQLARQEAQHAREGERSRLETNLQRAFEMVLNEDDSYEVIGDAIRESVDDFKVELLVADSSRAHFRQVVATEGDAHQGCPVGDPRECPATSRTQTLRFTSSSSMPVCPHLRNRPDGPLSAVCIPVSIAGKSVAVLHAMGPDGVTPDPDTVETLSLIGRKSGERLGTLRAFARTEVQARTDSLTGLLNRRSLENRVLELIEDNRPYVVAYGDVDHFKQLNDVHGHDAGDRALRLFGRVLRDSVRPSDLPARYGGEEFVIVLPDCGVDAAVAVIERFRERLALLLIDGRIPPFTVSFGVAQSAPDLLFSEAVERADGALLVAKATGRNRVVTSDDWNIEPTEQAPAEVVTG
jgi:diguanylate cyclase (GGDEF)-like protein